MKKTVQLTILLAVLMSMVSTKAFAYDFSVKNSDGKAIYMNYINNGNELEVTYLNNGASNKTTYTGTIVIPKEVYIGGIARKVTRIGQKAFNYCSDLLSVTIPNSITSIETYAFAKCSSLTSITIPNSVVTINANAFGGCTGLTSVTIGNSVTTIEMEAFYNCPSITSLTIPNSVNYIGNAAFAFCWGIASVTIPSSVTRMGYNPFYCNHMTEIYVDKENQYFVSKNGVLFNKDMSLLIGYPTKKTDTTYSIPNSVKTIGKDALRDCDYLTSVTIPHSVTTIDEYAFYHSSSLSSITIPSSVTSIGNAAFNDCNLVTIISQIENPFYIVGNSSSSYRTFYESTFNEAILYIPTGTMEKYKATEGWKDFVNIVEGTGPSGDNSEVKQCSKPKIFYSKGKLSFESETEGVTFISTITDSDINTYNEEEVPLTVTYHINVNAKKVGYLSSEMAEATLCWIEVNPQKEGISEDTSTDAKQLQALPVLIQAEGGEISIDGAPEGTKVAVYDAGGVEVGTAISHGGKTLVPAHLPQGSIAIVKIGEKAVKVAVK